MMVPRRSTLIGSSFIGCSLAWMFHGSHWFSKKKTSFIEDELVWAISCVSSVLVAWAQLAYCCTIRMNRLCLEHFWSSSPANGAFSRWISINKQSITFDQVWMWWQRAFLNSNRSLGGSICTQVVKGSFIFFWFWTGFCFFFGPWTVLECGGLYALKLMFFFFFLAFRVLIVNNNRTTHNEIAIWRRPESHNNPVKLGKKPVRTRSERVKPRSKLSRKL